MSDNVCSKLDLFFKVQTTLRVIEESIKSENDFYGFSKHDLFLFLLMVLLWCFYYKHSLFFV